MAKAKRGAKAQAIRDYHTAHPDAKATDIIKALREQRNIKVSPNQVYSIISKPKAKPRVKSNGQPAGDMPLIHAKQFVVAAGGLEQARKTLDFIESLQLP